MLKPFQIRDLQEPLSRDPEELSTRSNGVVQISAVEYDDLALNHPRARLSYLDDDDGDKIEVGSSLELSQRLDEPVEVETTQVSNNELAPMHLFDIRRSNSVTELWKRFGNQAAEAPESAEMKMNVFAPDEYIAEKPAGDRVPDTAVSTDSPTKDLPPLLTGYETEVASLSHRAIPPLPNLSHLNSSVEDGPNAHSVPGEDPQPLMAAFEAELESLMNSTEDTGARTQRTTPSHESSQGADSSSQRTPHPVEVLAAHVLTHLTTGANMVQSEFAARLPELQRQLRDARDQLEDAQRTLPDNVRASLQALLTTVETHMKFVLNSVPAGGRQFAEDAIHAGRPVAENAADSFRMMASEVNDFGKSLYAAFEEEFGRSGFAPNNMGRDPSNNPGTAASGGPNNYHRPSEPNLQDTQILPMVSKTEAAADVSEKVNASNVPSGNDGLYQDSQAGGGFPYPSSLHQHHHDHHHHRGPRPHMRPPQPVNPPLYAGHWGHPQHPTFWPAWEPRPWNLAPPTHHPHARHFSPPSSHSRPPPPPPYPGRWPVPGSFGHLFTNPPSDSSHHNQNNPPPKSAAPESAAQSPARDNNVQGDGQNKTLFIGNVGFNVSERMIKDVFAAKGFIVDVDLPLDSGTGKHAGFGYLHFPSKYPALAAIGALQGECIDGYAINLEFSDSIPIQNVHATPKTNSNGDSQSATQSDPEQAPSSHSPRQGGTIKRRKSVTFKEPSSQRNKAGSISSPNVDGSQVGSPSLIDLSIEDSSGSTRVPSDQARDISNRDLNDEDKSLSNFNPETEMSRFPPVSQLEAQLVAQLGQDRACPSGPHSNPASEPHIRRSHTTSEARPARALSRPSLPEMKSNSTGPSLRRWNTMVFPRSGVAEPAHSDDIQLSEYNRRLSEQHSSRPNAETDTWARLDRRERHRSRRSSQHSIPGSFPTEETAVPLVSVATSPDHESTGLYSPEIESCVSSLIDMGYGTAEDGGRSRMAVYAAASDGSLLDAIEMIEEERKVYARQDHV